MKFNLKNPLWKTDPKRAKEGLEKELKEKIFINCQYKWKEKCKVSHCLSSICLREPTIKIWEILGVHKNNKKSEEVKL